MNIPIKRLKKEAKIPERGSEQAAGYDLFAVLDADETIKPHEAKLIPTGIAVAIPSGYYGGVFARSGLSLKEGLRPANCVGVIDADYRGEIFVSLRNDSDTIRTVTPGEKIAQLLVLPFLEVAFDEVDALDDTDRGAGGFGSTGL